jgi:hypothetical protein
LPDRPIGRPVEFGQITVTGDQGCRAAQFRHPNDEVGVEQGQPQLDRYNRPGSGGGQQHGGAQPGEQMVGKAASNHGAGLKTKPS